MRSVAMIVTSLVRGATLAGLLATAGLVSGGCGEAAASRTKETILVTGSSTVAPLMQEIGRRFEAEAEGVRVDVQTGGSSRGIADARQGLAAVGMVSRSPRPGEDDLRWFPVARDGIALIVHRDNPVVALSDSDVVAIYAGTIDSWAALGGPDEPITVVQKAGGRSTLEVFMDHFGLEPSAVRADIIIGDNQQGIKTVAGNRWAIGYVSVGTAEYEAERGVAIRLLPARGIPATVEAVGADLYPIARTLHLVTAADPAGAVKELLDFARSGAVHDLVAAHYFVPQDAD